MDFKIKWFWFGEWWQRAAWLIFAASFLVFSAGCLPGNGVLGARPINETAVIQTTAVVEGSATKNLTAVIVADNITRKQVCPNQQNIQLPLTHVSLNCTDCHGDATIIAQLKVAPQDCNVCHQKDDKHNGSYGIKCGECHGATSWKEATIDHNKTSYPLTGKHSSIACLSCHVNGVYKGTPNTCIACHASKDVHKGAFGQNCADCHTTGAWKPATYNKPHTVFPINHGSGRTASTCSTCHPTGLLQYTCYGCHQHTVSNILSRHRNTQNLADCVRCHQSGRSRGSD
jgi:hypothetical protein